MNLGEKIIALRKKEGMTQEDLAGKLNVSRQTISKWELCQSHPELNFIVKLSELFGVTTDYLIKDESVNESEEVKEIEPSNNVVVVKQGLSARQIVGIIVASLGGLFAIISMILMVRDADFILGIIGGVVIAVVGFEMLLIKKHCLLKILWTLWGMSFAPSSLFVVNSVGNPFTLNNAGGIMSCLGLVFFIVLVIYTIIVKRNSAKRKYGSEKER